jgi:hypothetical protein
MTALDIASKPPGGADRFAPFLSYLPNLLPDGWFVLRFSGAPQETVLARCGAVEIRRTEEGCAAQTRVKGEREQALATALHRLRQFLCRNERSGVDLRLSRPLVISEEAPCRWLVRIGLRGRHSGIISPLREAGG